MRKKHKKTEIGSCIFLLYRVTKLNKNVCINIRASQKGKMGKDTEKDIV